MERPTSRAGTINGRKTRQHCRQRIPCRGESCAPTHGSPSPKVRRSEGSDFPRGLGQAVCPKGVPLGLHACQKGPLTLPPSAGGAPVSVPRLLLEKPLFITR